MAQFMGEMQGSRGSASRLGSKESGLQGHLRGWTIGIRVTCAYDEKQQKEVICVYLTSGSNGKKPDKFLGKYTVDDLDGGSPKAKYRK